MNTKQNNPTASQPEACAREDCGSTCLTYCQITIFLAKQATVALAHQSS